MKNDGDNKGFTLLELMLVISIISIILLIAAPKFGSSKAQIKLHSTARMCVVDIRYTQQLSIDTKNKHGIYFTQTGYQIKNMETGGVVKTVKFSSGIVYEKIEGMTENELIFGIDGTPLRSDGITPIASTARITIRSPEFNFYVFVNVTPRTGEVSHSWQ